MRLTQIADKPLNFTSIFIQNDWGVEMATAIKSEDSYLDSTNQLVYQKASRFIKDFALSEYHEASEEITIQKANKETKNNQIMGQESIIARVRGDKLMVKEQKQILNELKRDRQKISNRISKEERNIITANSNINKANRAISLNEREQEKQNELIRLQMEYIYSVRLKPDAIK